MGNVAALFKNLLSLLLLWNKYCQVLTRGETNGKSVTSIMRMYSMKGTLYFKYGSWTGFGIEGNKIFMLALSYFVWVVIEEKKLNVVS